MLTRILFCGAVTLTCAQADFQYQSTSRMTGGTLLQMTRFVPGAGAMKEPQVSTIAFQGNRMVRKDKRQAEVIDLDKRTITTVNFEKHTWSEMTFDQMKQMLEDASKKMSEKSKDGDKVNLDVDADIKDAGQTRTINGLDAHLVIMTMSMTATDPQSGQAGAMKMTTDMWLSKNVPGSAEAREFYTRMAKELDWAPTGANPLMSRPDLAKAMAKMMAAGGKMEGTPVQQIMRMGGDGATGDAPQSQSAPAAPQTARPSVSDALSGALGAKLGGFGGFGKKKKDAAPADAPPAAADASAPQASGALMEMTIDNTGFSTSSVDSSLFAVPGDFKKVDAAQPGGRSR